MKRELIVTLLIVMSMLFSSCEKSESGQALISTADEAHKTIISTTEAQICVYIVGEVLCPGVYNLVRDARICDAVDAAGGFTENAAIEAINLASKVNDGEKIVVYSISEVENGEVVTEVESSLININKADVSALTTLPGIGEARANDIINYREENGDFGSIDEIMNVSGIKEAAFARIKDLITVN